MLFDTCFRIVTEKYASGINDKASSEDVKPSFSNPENIKSLDLLTTFENTSEPVISETLFLSDSTEEKGVMDSTLVSEDSLFVQPDSTSILSDSTFITSDSISILLDSTLVNYDSTLAPKDSIPVNLDSLRLYEMGLDSTNRLRYFRYQREDKPYVELKEKQESKFFVEPTATFKRRTIKLDSTGKYVEVRELIASQETKIRLRMPIEDYIGMKLALRERENWEQLGYDYKLKETKIGLGELITSLTDFEIPLPSVGVLSIFGQPKISLKIGGNVTIHGAWRSETTEGFKQTVQINVNGTIGDKLNIIADWNTERTFEYENQLKLKYTGYDHEIIQSIEAGNVSMQTSSLIGGAEALFGIKAHFKLGPFSLTALASQKKGETKEVSVSGGTTAQDYDKRAYDYSENHFFIDTVYASRNLKLFEYFHSNIPPKQVLSHLKQLLIIGI
jgi:hypothetical protein